MPMHLFSDSTFLLQYEDFKFYWNVVISDHHDGVITAVLGIYQGKHYTQIIKGLCLQNVSVINCDHIAYSERESITNTEASVKSR